MSGYGLKNTKDRHRAYLDLWDAFQKHGCPVCTLVERQCRHDMDELINKVANNLEEDMTHRDPMLICNWHIREIWALCSSAIRHRIMEDALRIQEMDLKEILLKYEESSIRLMLLHKLRWKKSPVNRLLRRMNSCRLCQNIVHAEAHYLETLLNNMAEIDFSTEFKRSTGLCFPHMVKALAAFPYHGNSLLLIKAMIDKIKILRMELSEAKYYYGRQDIEATEIDFQQKILETIVGRQEAYRGQVECEMGYTEKMGAHFSPASSVDESAEKYGDENSQPVTEKLRFEIGKLQRQNEKLRSDCMRERSRVASLHYRYWECNEDNKRLKMNLIGARANASASVQHVERLNEEIRKLQETLTNRETTKDVTRNYE